MNAKDYIRTPGEMMQPVDVRSSTFSEAFKRCVNLSDLVNAHLLSQSAMVEEAQRYKKLERKGIRFKDKMRVFRAASDKTHQALFKELNRHTATVFGPMDFEALLSEAADKNINLLQRCTSLKERRDVLTSCFVCEFVTRYLVKKDEPAEA